MKTTFFIRILLSALLPVLLVIIIIIATASNIIRQDGTAHAWALVELTAGSISEKAAMKLESAAEIQNDISKRIADIDFNDPEAKQTADSMLNTLILSNRDLYCVWFAFEPGVLDNGRYYKTLLREDGNVFEIDDLSDERLNEPEESPWYNEPLSTGRVYANVEDYYDFNTGEGLIHVFTMAHPITTTDGQTIGCVGLDIRYENLFPMNGFTDEPAQRTMLVSHGGMILYSPIETDIGHTLWEYDFESASEISQAMYGAAKWQGEIDSPFSGQRMLLCLYPFEIAFTGQTIYLYRDAPTAGLYGSHYSSMQVIAATGVLGTILLGFCLFVTSRSIVKHVRRITDSFNRVANGSAEDTLGGEQIPIYATNVVELDALQDALISMMVQLRKAHAHVLRAVEAEVEKEKVMAASQAKENFFATMSHEIRTPMNAILGISEIMLYDGDLTPAQEKYIQDIKISSDSLLNIINDILDISKLETCNMELHPEHYNFRALMDNITSLAKHLVADANLEFFFEPDGELPLCLYGDVTRLRQVLLNLIGNAVNFTKSGSVTLRVSIQDETIRFSVADTGIGIKEEAIATIFEAFKRLDTRRSREVRGTGLGLSISQSLVELMGGAISVESVYGEGSVFTVSVPLVLGDEEKLRRTKTGNGTRYSDSLRVLVVDDDATNLSVSTGLLKAMHGIRCDTAASGYEAIIKAKKTDYDIIFMDHMMPELDGVDTTQSIRRLGGKNKVIPIIALTANAMIGTKKELLDGGMDDFLTKPIQSDKLQEILDTWIPMDKRLPEAAMEKEATPVAENMVSNRNDISDPVMKNLLEQAGVNTLAGLENIGFDEKMYIQSLQIFRETLPDSIRLLEELMERSNMRELYIRTHGLKGSLANIGASILSEDTKTIETAAQNNYDECHNLLPPLINKLQAFHKALCEALPDANDRLVSAPINREALYANLTKLCAALEKYEYETVTDALESVLSMSIPPETNDFVSLLKLAIDSFDYPGAIALIRNDILSKL